MAFLSHSTAVLFISPSLSKHQKCAACADCILQPEELCGENIKSEINRKKQPPKNVPAAEKHRRIFQNNGFLFFFLNISNIDSEMHVYFSGSAVKCGRQTQFLTSIQQCGRTSTAVNNTAISVPSAPMSHLCGCLFAISFTLCQVTASGHLTQRKELIYPRRKEANQISECVC